METMMLIFLPIISFALLYIGWKMEDIRIELRYRNTLAKEQNEIFAKERK